MRGSLDFGIDDAGMQQVLGYLEGISSEAARPEYMGAVLEYAHSKLSTELDLYIDNVARAAPETLHHVYEWPKHWEYASHSPTVGDPTQRLWIHTMSGHGKNKTASFRFLASKVPTPVNPTLRMPGKSGKRVKTGVHIFHWKAPVMEAGMDITVDAKLSNYLAFISWDDQHTQGSSVGASKQRDDKGNTTGIVFAKQTSFIAGGGSTTGVFSGLFLNWWMNQAGAIFDAKIVPELQNDLVEEGTLRALGMRTRPANKLTMSLRDRNRGFDRAKAEMTKKRRKYIDGAAARRRFLYNGL